MSKYEGSSGVMQLKYERLQGVTLIQGRFVLRQQGAFLLHKHLTPASADFMLQSLEPTGVVYPSYID